MINCPLTIKVKLTAYQSTVDTILKFTDAIYDNFNSGAYLLSFLLDYSKAFDTIDHNILSMELSRRIGFRNSTLILFKSYLHDRRQYVYRNNDSSPFLPMIIGVPQGSILGLLLFLIY